MLRGDKVELKTKREEKERGVSISKMIEDLTKEEENIKSLIYVFTDNDGVLHSSYSLENNLEMVGRLEYAKHLILEDVLY